MTPSISVAVVDAETPGNVGTIARAMKNFGLSELVLVDPPDIAPGSEAYGFAGRARDDVLAGARVIEFDELVEGYHTVAFTALANPTDTKHVRYPVSTPVELADRLAGVDADTVLVFGRERIGLTNDELARMDELCTIPANPSYSSLNLGQAATVALYELRSITLGEPNTQLPDEPHPRASQAELEALFEHFVRTLEAVDYPPERREKAEIVLRRLLGRADPTDREVTTVHGVLSRIEYHLNNPQTDE